MTSCLDSRRMQSVPLPESIRQDKSKDYPRYGDVDWIGQITDLIADIIRNKRRSTFRRQKKASDGPHRGRGRPPMSEEEKV